MGENNKYISIRVLKEHKEQLQLKTLADIAPYILDLMKLPIPKEMKRQ